MKRFEPNIEAKAKERSDKIFFKIKDLNNHAVVGFTDDNLFLAVCGFLSDEKIEFSAKKFSLIWLPELQGLADKVFIKKVS